MGTSKILIFQVLEIQEAEKLSVVNIFYADPDNQTIPANMLHGMVVTYPEDIIEKEMNKREINKYEKHSLY